ncbi:L,D-transpeptidase family protein [Dyadobacter chenhuakuii]|uniref:L,D-transpeptidase family protein n=1 Tax=Dyadobacter chenhuakuii TaxID=2909339 RepID=A0ABY4XLA0_9BACT|nr:L,D-transpeptidase family protein [Dyadobacter chenhuakuii]MCF2494081.1 L,D-transpeptidase family protein [Dyadobacter chenhuakuii]USJ31210.1 L,D-transpeptidase family protein [Dyadobacter chenhuakuii]
MWDQIPVHLISRINASLVFVMMLMMLASCQTKQEKKQPEVAKRDTSIKIENSFTQLFIDTTALAGFVQSHSVDDSLVNKLQSFYNRRNYQFAWFFPDGMAEFVPTFLALQNDYIYVSGDSSLYDPALLASIDTLGLRNHIIPTDTLVIKTELALTEHFFRYTQKAYSGDRNINIQDLDWFIPRKKVNPAEFLDSLLKNKGANLASYEPVNRQYNLLTEQLKIYHPLANQDWKEINSTKTLKLGDSSAEIPEIKRRLALLQDLKQADSTNLFDSTLFHGVRSFQTRMGLKASGQISAAFFKELNVPVAERIRQMLINMERIRWVPAAPETDYILVNIPEYRLHMYEKGQLAFSMNAVVGSQVHSTVIFSGKLNQIVFSPYWNVPPSILKREILPGIKRNKNYLARHNMEWNGGSVRQKPGKSNSLGLVKFLFPNSYNIYLHDTPSKNLFAESQRAFSHGCIRLSEPKKLAEFLLRSDSTWTTDKITIAMNSGKEKYVRLRGSNEIPVFIGYFTAWVDHNGKVNFRKDIYGHDQKMAERLFDSVK